MALSPLTFPDGADAPSGGWDLSFLSRLKGAHRQVFDCSALPNLPLRSVGRWYRAHRDVSGLAPHRLNALVGITSACFPINASDALWTRYPIGRLWDVKDPRTGTAATRNVYADISPDDRAKGLGLGTDESVSALVANGAVFWQCNHALNGVIARIAAEVHEDPAVTDQVVREGLLPHVIVVPAHTMVLGLAQAKGCAYQAV